MVEWTGDTLKGLCSLTVHGFRPERLYTSASTLSHTHNAQCVFVCVHHLQDVDHLPCVVLTNAETNFWRSVQTLYNNYAHSV